MHPSIKFIFIFIFVIQFAWAAQIRSEKQQQQQTTNEQASDLTEDILNIFKQPDQIRDQYPQQNAMQYPYQSNMRYAYPSFPQYYYPSFPQFSYTPYNTMMQQPNYIQPEQLVSYIQALMPYLNQLCKSFKSNNNNNDDDNLSIGSRFGTSTGITLDIVRPSRPNFRPPPLINHGLESQPQIYYPMKPEPTPRPQILGVSACMYAIVDCCPKYPNGGREREVCLALKNCRGPFWGTHPCASDLAKEVTEFVKNQTPI